MDSWLSTVLKGSSHREKLTRMVFYHQGLVLRTRMYKYTNIVRSNILIIRSFNNDCRRASHRVAGEPISDKVASYHTALPPWTLPHPCLTQLLLLRIRSRRLFTHFHTQQQLQKPPSCLSASRGVARMSQRLRKSWTSDDHLTSRPCRTCTARV